MALPNDLYEPTGQVEVGFPREEVYSIWVAFSSYGETEYVRMSFNVLASNTDDPTAIPSGEDLVTAMVDGLRAAGRTAYGAHTTAAVTNAEINPATP